MSEQGVTRRSVLRGTALGILGAALPATETIMASPARADAAPLTLTVNAAQPGHAVSPDLFGAFFEEINYAGVGGIYAELIRNRAFMDPATPGQWVPPADIPRVPGKFGSAMTLNPSSLPATTQDYVGKSQFPPDPVLDAAVDEVQIYDRALSAAEIQSLTTSAGGTAGGGNVAWYRFDEAKGDVAVDASGHGRNGTIVPVITDWTLVQDGGGSATASLDSGTPLNDQLDRSLHLAVTSAAAGQRVGMANGGYFGVPVVPGRTYRVSFFAKASGRFSGPLTVSLETADGSQAFASTQVSGLTAAWKRFSATLRVPAGVTESAGNRFVIGIDNRSHHVAQVPAGTSVWLQVVSLFPPTYRNRPNGLRPDLVNLVRAMGPKIFRFPGGNYVEGVTVDTRWNWKQTIGPV
jgi:hypothetical protein